MKRRSAWWAAAGAVAVLLGACTRTSENPALTGSPPASSPAPRSITLPMREQNNSGQNGTAVLTAEGAQTKVIVTLTNPPNAAQPMHIHPGTCAQLDPKPTYPLTDLQNGKSETLVPATLDSLLASKFAINAHKSKDEVAIYVSCGEISAG